VLKSKTLDEKWDSEVTLETLRGEALVWESLPYITTEH
jgi:hypothetical protein